MTEQVAKDFCTPKHLSWLHFSFRTINKNICCVDNDSSHSGIYVKPIPVHIPGYSLNDYRSFTGKRVFIVCANCVFIFRAGQQRNCSCPSHLATSSSGSVRAGSVTPSRIGTFVYTAEWNTWHFLFRQYKVLPCSLFSIPPPPSGL